MPFGIHPEILILLLIIALIFGAKRLPELGSSMGKSIKEFQKAVKNEDTAAPQNQIPTVATSAAMQTDQTEKDKTSV